MRLVRGDRAVVEGAVMMKRRWWLRVVGGFLGLWLAFLVWITWAGMRTELRRVDCLVVLGARALADGTPGPSLRARLERALELWRAGWAPALVCTGGRGQDGTVEGEVERNWLLGRGVPAAAVLWEDRSHTTRENFVEASRLMRERGWRSCLVVTDPFHEPRAMSMARAAGLDASPAPTFSGPAWQRWGTWSFYTVRESAGWVKYLLGY